MRSWRLPFVVTVVLVPLIGGAAASAQPQGRIIGIVRDATGAQAIEVAADASKHARLLPRGAATEAIVPLVFLFFQIGWYVFVPSISG